MASVTTAFIPVADPIAAAQWYSSVLGLRLQDANPLSAVLHGDGDTSVTLMGPRSGIATRPGLQWATCNFKVDDLPATREALEVAGASPGLIEGDQNICLFVVAWDPDGNAILLTDR